MARADLNEAVELLTKVCAQVLRALETRATQRNAPELARACGDAADKLIEVSVLLVTASMA